MKLMYEQLDGTHNSIFPNCWRFYRRGAPATAFSNTWPWTA